MNNFGETEFLDVDDFVINTINVNGNSFSGISSAGDLTLTSLGKITIQEPILMQSQDAITNIFVQDGLFVETVQPIKNGDVFNVTQLP